jgi:hypothetical protein
MRPFCRYVGVVLASFTAALAFVTSATAKPRSFTVIGVPTSYGHDSTKENLYSGKQKVGHDLVLCNNRSICDTTFYFKSGTIKTRGHVATTNPFFTTIVGGSGAYKRAKGRVKVYDISSTRDRYTFEFR